MFPAKNQPQRSHFIFPNPNYSEIPNIPSHQYSRSQYQAFPINIGNLQSPSTNPKSFQAYYIPLKTPPCTPLQSTSQRPFAPLQSPHITFQSTYQPLKSPKVALQSPINPIIQSHFINGTKGIINPKKDMESIYNECLSKLAKERENLISPSKSRISKLNERENLISPSKNRISKVYDQKNNTIYEGQLIEGLKDGIGVLKTINNEEIYNGDWKLGYFEGIGVLKNLERDSIEETFDYKDFKGLQRKWDRYEGSFKKGYKEGFGTLYLSNGEIFHGNFEKDRVNGEGTFIRKGGEIVIGRWKDDEMILVY